MNWKVLQNPEDLNTIDKLSEEKPVLIYKHSTRCGTSSTALNRIERNWKENDEEKIAPFFVDVIDSRNISNAIETHYGTRHESPQVIIIKKGKVVYTASHLEINYPEILEQS